MADNGIGFQSSSGYSANESVEAVENDKPHDPASSGLFGTDFRRYVTGKKVVTCRITLKILPQSSQYLGMMT